MNPRAATYYLLTQVGLVVVLGAPAAARHRAGARLLLAPIAGAVIGYIAPGLVLDRRIAQAAPARSRTASRMRSTC